MLCKDTQIATSLGSTYREAKLSISVQLCCVIVCPVAIKLFGAVELPPFRRLSVTSDVPFLEGFLYLALARKLKTYKFA